MSKIDQLKTSATHINSLLSRYIKLHNAFLESTGSIWSIFKKIDYQQLSGDAYFLFEELRDERNELMKLKDDPSGGIEKEFAESLHLYTKALTETVHLLFMLLHALKEKADGGKLSWNEHMENKKSYEKSIDLYMLKGEDLNRIYSTI